MRFLMKINRFWMVDVVILGITSLAWPLCVVEPVTPDDICWECTFPIRIAGVPITENPPGIVVEPPDPIPGPVCRCLIAVIAGVPIYRYGVTFGMWEPARYIETVKDPYCLPFLGTDLGSGLVGDFELRGSVRDQGNSEDSGVFAQAHFFTNPYWVVEEAAIDAGCWESQGDIPAYMTEIDPLWNDDQLAVIIHPESALFANLAAQLACMADATSAAAGLPLPPLYWCMGSWGSAYPLAGHMGDGRATEANAGAAARMIYKLLREMLMLDFSVSHCHGVHTPIWVKYHWRLQIARPEVGRFVIPMGQTAIFWDALKNPVTNVGQDNFVWILFRRRFCCLGDVIGI